MFGEPKGGFRWGGYFVNTPLNFVRWKRYWPVSDWQAEGPDSENVRQGSYGSGVKR